MADAGAAEGEDAEFLALFGEEGDEAEGAGKEAERKEKQTDVNGNMYIGSKAEDKDFAGDSSKQKNADDVKKSTFGKGSKGSENEKPVEDEVVRERENGTEQEKEVNNEDDEEGEEEEASSDEDVEVLLTTGGSGEGGVGGNVSAGMIGKVRMTGAASRWQRPGFTAPERGGGGGKTGGVLSMLPQPTLNIGGGQKSVYDLEIGKLTEKPWNERGADLSDYFNYGFNEATWKLYCERQVQMRLEATMLAKIKTVSSSGRQSVAADDAKKALAAVKVQGDNGAPATGLKKGGSGAASGGGRERGRPQGNGSVPPGLPPAMPPPGVPFFPPAGRGGPGFPPAVFPGAQNAEGLNGPPPGNMPVPPPAIFPFGLPPGLPLPPGGRGFPPLPPPGFPVQPSRSGGFGQAPQVQSKGLQGSSQDSSGHGGPAGSPRHMGMSIPPPGMMPPGMAAGMPPGIQPGAPPGVGSRNEERGGGRDRRGDYGGRGRDRDRDRDQGFRRDRSGRFADAGQDRRSDSRDPRREDRSGRRDDRHRYEDRKRDRGSYDSRDYDDDRPSKWRR